VEFVDANGVVIATFGGGKAYDSSSNEVEEPATVAVATRLLATTTGAGSTAGSATVEISVDPTWIADAARTFPVTIDPHMATGTSFFGSTGTNGSANVDAYVDEANPTVAEGVQDSGRLLAGYRPIGGANKASTTLVSFNLGDLVGSENTITSAQFSLWNNYSYSCSPAGLWVDAATSSWNPATVTWNTRPAWANVSTMKTFAHGYSSSCAAAAEFYDVTPIVQKWSNGVGGYNGGMANNGFIITANGSAVTGYKRFNSAETGSGMPGLTVTWENCTNYPAGAGGSGTRKVCGAIRDGYTLGGGPAGFGLPTTTDASTPNGKGYFNHFDKAGQGRSIYWSPSSGAHSVIGAIRDKWAADGWETSLEGWPSSDDRATPSGEGAYNHFLNLADGQTRSIYWTPQYGAHRVGGLIRDRWASLNWETNSGYPTTEEIDTPGGGGRVSYFAPISNGQDGRVWGVNGIYWKNGSPAAWSVHGPFYQTYRAMGETSSWLGYPISNEYHSTTAPDGGTAPADATRIDFENGSIYGDPRTGYVAVASASVDAPAQRIDDSAIGSSNLQFEYSGNWSTCDGCGDGQAYQDGFRYSFDAGSTVIFRFTAAQATIYGTREPGSGIAQVSVDGGTPVDVDMYSPTDKYNALFTTPAFTSGSHTVRLTVSGRKNASSSATGLAVDWAQVGGVPEEADQAPLVIEDDRIGTQDNSFEYTGAWQECINCPTTPDYSNYHYSEDVGSSATLRFTGVRASLWAVLGDAAGIASISVDGGPGRDVDLFSETYETAAIFTTDPLTYGSHTITVTETGNQDVASTSSSIAIDRAEVQLDFGASISDVGGESDVDMDAWILNQARDPILQSSIPYGQGPQTLDAAACETTTDGDQYCLSPLSGADLSDSDASLQQEAERNLQASPSGDYCDRQKSSNQDRRNICEIGGAAVIRWVRGVNVGQVNLKYRSHAWVNSRLKADQILRFSTTWEVMGRSGSNPPSAASALGMALDCSGACTATGGSDGSRLLLTTGNKKTWSFTANPQIARGAIGFASLSWLPTGYIAGGGVANFARKSLRMRCDAAVGSYAGCVNPGKRAIAQFSRTQSRELAVHIATAQSNGLPKRLTRSTESSAQVDARRRRVCGLYTSNIQVNRKIVSCDEYPFASSLQGGNLPTRIPPGCIWPVTGYNKSRPDANGSSRCLVPVAQQNLQSAIIGNMTSLERVMQGESYDVQVVQ
jgi:hypothetical protein